MEPVKLPIEDVLDLHHFQPKEVPSLLEDYLEECYKAGFETVRIIHGKGGGILKKIVGKALKRNELAVSFKDASMDSGGWGATVVELKRRENRE